MAQGRQEILQGILIAKISSARSRISPPPMGRKAGPLESENAIKEMIKRKGGKEVNSMGATLLGRPSHPPQY
jgi:hypothetical protein